MNEPARARRREGRSTNRPRRTVAAPEVPDAWISPVDDEAGLGDLLGRLAATDRYGFDTEFHRERTFYPRVALVQLSWREPPAAGSSEPPLTRAALVDPLGVGIGPFADLLRKPVTMVVHAAEQDLEILHHLCGTGPVSLFDTQVAAGFAGHSSASLADLVRHYLGFDLPKADRLTDWSARPLGSSQLRYAVADVAFLLDLDQAIREDLERRGRLAWAEEECDLLRRRAARPPDPDRAWWRLHDARALRGASRGVAQVLARWREERARRLDVPQRFVLPDLALQAIAHRPPADRAQLDTVRGMEPRFLRDGAAEEILDAVARGLELNPGSVQPPPAEDVPKDLRPAVSLAMAWLGQLARDEDVDPATLATRSDVVDLLLGRGGRLYEGWRAELVGEPIWRLVAGFASVAYDGAGNLALEERSYHALEPFAAVPGEEPATGGAEAPDAARATGGAELPGGEPVPGEELATGEERATGEEPADTDLASDVAGSDA